MDTAVFKIIENIIGVPYVEESFETGTVCLAMDEDLRFDFQTQFAVYDVVNYIYGIVNRLYLEDEINSKNIQSLLIPYPVDASFFWENSALGKKIRLIYPIRELECRAVQDFNWVRN